MQILKFFTIVILALSIAQDSKGQDNQTPEFTVEVTHAKKLGTTPAVRDLVPVSKGSAEKRIIVKKKYKKPKNFVGRFPSKKIEGIFDDNTTIKELLSIPVFDYDTFDKKLIDELIVSVGINSVRKFIVGRIQVNYGTVIHSKAYVSKYAFIDKAFFKNITVCTIDQVLTQGFNLGFWEVKTFHQLTTTKHTRHTTFIG